MGGGGAHLIVRRKRCSKGCAFLEKPHRKLPSSGADGGGRGRLRSRKGCQAGQRVSNGVPVGEGVQQGVPPQGLLTQQLLPALQIDTLSFGLQFAEQVCKT